MTTAHPRSAAACESCRRRKVKCTGGNPCRACTKHRWECIFGHRRKRYSEAQVKHLLNEIQSYKVQLASRESVEKLGSQECSQNTVVLSPHISPSPSNLSTGNQLETNKSELPRSSHPLEQPKERDNQINLSSYQSRDTGAPGRNFGHKDYNDPADTAAGISPATDLTSGPEFECQVRSLLERSKTDGNRRVEKASQAFPNDEWNSLKSLVTHMMEPSIPSLEESKYLLNQFLFYLGESQHFFDSRAFSDSMIMFFQSPSTQEKQRHCDWYTEYLLVMAMAKLMDVENPTLQPPGSDLFAEAMRRLPPMHELSSGGVLTVEILTLITIYLQWSDRKHDAYLHIGFAIRLAIALKCNLPENEQDCLPSQSTHRLRLWWTVYMLDRRLSSSLGLAAGADERQLRAGFPKHAVGFQSPVAMTINIRIARVTDDIMSSLYGNTKLDQLELVGKIQSVIQELHLIGRSFPQSLLLDFSQPLQNVTRTGSSLYLMLLQAIILCTRPMLLYRVRIAAQDKQLQRPPELVSESLARLCSTCHEAATRSLAILYALRQQRGIPRYGFFDLETTFSAAFVLVMVGFIDGCEDYPPSALVEAFEVLRFLSSSGNLAAEQRFRDIAQSCSHVWPGHDFSIADSDRIVSRVQNDFSCSGGARSTGFVSEISSIPQSQLGPAGRVNGANIPAANLGFQEGNVSSDSWNKLDCTDGAFDMQGELEIDFTGEEEGIYSSFYDPMLPLTGVDHMDWLEIEKVLNAPIDQ